MDQLDLNTPVSTHVNRIHYQMQRASTMDTNLYSLILKLIPRSTPALVKNWVDEFLEIILVRVQYDAVNNPNSLIAKMQDEINRRLSEDYWTNSAMSALDYLILLLTMTMVTGREFHLVVFNRMAGNCSQIDFGPLFQSFGLKLTGVGQVIVTSGQSGWGNADSMFIVGEKWYWIEFLTGLSNMRALRS